MDPSLKIPGLVTEEKIIEKYCMYGTSLVAQWLVLHAPNAGFSGLIPGQGTRSHKHAVTKSSYTTTKEPTCRNLINK